MEFTSDRLLFVEILDNKVFGLVRNSFRNSEWFLKIVSIVFNQSNLPQYVSDIENKIITTYIRDTFYKKLGNLRQASSKLHKGTNVE